MGVPHILIRVTGCRLRCQFSDSFCEHLISFGKGIFTLNDVVKVYESNPQIKHTMVTGGILQYIQSY